MADWGYAKLIVVWPIAGVFPLLREHSYFLVDKTAKESYIEIHPLS